MVSLSLSWDISEDLKSEKHVILPDNQISILGPGSVKEESRLCSKTFWLFMKCQKTMLGQYKYTKKKVD